MTQKGRQCFQECAQVVFELSTNRRVSDKKKDDKEIMEAVREGDCITDAHTAKLMSLHLDVIRQLHGPQVVDDIKEGAVYLFWTNDKRIQHNLSMLAKLNSPSNPSALFKTQSTCSKHAKGVNSHWKGDFPTSSFVCNGSKVALQGKNFWPLWGLHNGACATVKDIVYSPGTSPNKGDLPLYVVCDFPLYCGPVWDVNNPTVSFYIHLDTWCVYQFNPFCVSFCAACSNSHSYF
jgi:hypothetical protein